MLVVRMLDAGYFEAAECELLKQFADECGFACVLAADDVNAWGAGHRGVLVVVMVGDWLSGSSAHSPPTAPPGGEQSRGMIICSKKRGQ
jgi:hypothetical protein